MVAEVPNDPDRRRTWWCPRCQPGPGPRTALISLVVLDEADDVALGVADVDPAHDLRHRLDLPDL